MVHPPAFWDSQSNADAGHDDPIEGNPAEAILGLSAASGGYSAGQSSMAGSRLLGAVSTLLALTPRGRTEELARLTALAHGYIGIAGEDELVALAKAVASRDDINSGLADRIARASERAAHTFIRANRLSDETIAYFLECGSEETRVLIARHHRLQGKHITMLVADGSGPVLQALLENRQTDFSADAQKLVERRMASIEPPEPEMPALPAQPSVRHSHPSGSADPRRSARDFASLDSAGRRAVMRRLAEDQPATISLQAARRSLDPTRNDADLAFLTVVEQRDPAKLGALFAQTLDLDPQLVGRLMDEADGDALLVMARAVGLSSTAFARMLILGKTGLTGSPQDTFNLVDRFNAMPEATAQLIVQAMRDGAASKPPRPAPSTERRLPESRAETPAEPARPQPRSILSLADGKGSDRGSGPQGFRKAV